MSRRVFCFLRACVILPLLTTGTTSEFDWFVTFNAFDVFNVFDISEFDVFNTFNEFDTPNEFDVFGGVSRMRVKSICVTMVSRRWEKCSA